MCVIEEIVIRALPGSDIREACEYAMKLSSEHGWCEVSFRFNGVDMKVGIVGMNKGVLTSADIAVEYYHKQLQVEG